MRKNIDWTKAKQMYDEGHCDQDIADVIGCSRSYVCTWRRVNGYMTKQSRIRTNSHVFNKLYALGYTDKMIADHIGVHITTVWLYRRKHGIPPHIPKRDYSDVDAMDAPDEYKPWRDPESLYCDAVFLENITGKKIKE